MPIDRVIARILMACKIGHTQKNTGGTFISHHNPSRFLRLILGVFDEKVRAK